MMEERKDLAIGVFEQEAQAEQAVSALWRAGFAPDRIDMANRRMGVVPGTPRMQFQKDAAEGATAGAVVGAASGAVAGAVAGSLMPVVGTVLGGISGATLGAAALGAAGGTFIGPFLAMQISEEDANHYSTAIDQGRTLVIVRQIGRSDEARDILRAHGGMELPDYLVHVAQR
jgi:outer membrane lipoprotein SlyB